MTCLRILKSMKGFIIKRFKGILNKKGNVSGTSTNFIIFDGFKIDNVEEMLAFDFSSAIEYFESLLEFLL